MKQQKKHQHLAYLEYQRKRQAELLKFIHAFSYKEEPSLQTKKSVRNIVATITKDSERLGEQIFPYLHKSTSIDKSIDESFIVEKMDTEERYAQTPWIDIESEFNTIKNTSTSGVQAGSSLRNTKSVLQIQSAPASPQVLKEELEMATILREASKLSIGKSSPGASCVDLRYKREIQKIPELPRNLSMDSAILLSTEPSLIDLEGSPVKFKPTDDSAINLRDSVPVLDELPASPSAIMSDILESYSNPISPNLIPDSSRSPIDNLDYIVDVDDQYFEDVLRDESPKHVMQVKDVTKDTTEIQNLSQGQSEKILNIYDTTTQTRSHDRSNNSPTEELTVTPTVLDCSNNAISILDKKQPSIPEEIDQDALHELSVSIDTIKQSDVVFIHENDHEEEPKSSFEFASEDGHVQSHSADKPEPILIGTPVINQSQESSKMTINHTKVIFTQENINLPLESNLFENDAIDTLPSSIDTPVPIENKDKELAAPSEVDFEFEIDPKFPHNSPNDIDKADLIGNEMTAMSANASVKSSPIINSDLANSKGSVAAELIHFNEFQTVEIEPEHPTESDASVEMEIEPTLEMRATTDNINDLDSSDAVMDDILSKSSPGDVPASLEYDGPTNNVEQEFVVTNDDASPTLDYALYDSPLKASLESSTDVESPDVTITDSAIAESEPVSARNEVRYIAKLSSKGMNATTSHSNASTMMQDLIENDSNQSDDKADHNDLISSIIQNVLKLEKYEDDMLKNYMDIKSKIDEISERLNKLEDIELSDLLGEVISQIGMFKSNIVKTSKNVDFLGLIDKEEQKLKKTVRFRLPKLQHDTLSDSMSNQSIRTAPQNMTKRQSISSNAASFDGTFKSKFVKTFKKPVLGKSERIKDRAFNITYYIYRPNLKDPLDVVFAKTVNSMLLTFPITFLAKGKYRFDASDTKIINIKLRGPDVMVRVGGGYITLIEFFEKGYFKNMMLRHKLIQGFNQ